MMTTKYIYEELVIIVKYQLLVHIHPLNAKCMHLDTTATVGSGARKLTLEDADDLPSQGANNVVHVRAIRGGTSERSCAWHELLCRQPVSIPSHIQGDVNVNVIHKLDCMPAY